MGPSTILTGPKHSGQKGVDRDSTGLWPMSSVTNGDLADWA